MRSLDIIGVKADDAHVAPEIESVVSLVFRKRKQAVEEFSSFARIEVFVFFEFGIVVILATFMVSNHHYHRDHRIIGANAVVMPGVGVLGEIEQDFAIGVDEFMKQIGSESASIWSIAIRMKIFAGHGDQAFQIQFIAIEEHVRHFLFFLPPVVLSDSDYAFWSCVIAHGFQ